MHSTKIQGRFNDTDMLGHINNAVYMSYLDVGKTDYFGCLKCKNYMEEPVDLINAHVDIDFLAQGTLREPLEVRSEITHIGNKSMNVHQQVVNSATGEVKCDANTIMVCFDFEHQCTVRLSDSWREAIERENNNKQ